MMINSFISDRLFLFFSLCFVLILGKTTRPLRYDLNQIPYDYTVEVRNSFKVLDLIDSVPEELWTEVNDIVQEAVIKTIPQKRNEKRQSGCLRRSYK